MAPTKLAVYSSMGVFFVMAALAIMATPGVQAEQDQYDSNTIHHFILWLKDSIESYL